MRRTPENCPSRLVAPAYAVIGTLNSRAMLTALTTSSVDLGRTTTECGDAGWYEFSEDPAVFTVSGFVSTLPVSGNVWRSFSIASRNSLGDAYCGGAFSSGGGWKYYLSLSITTDTC